MKGQTRLQSLIEAWANVGIGFGVALATQSLIFPLFGIHIPMSANLQITLVFTVVSVVRSYFTRRAFNWWHTRR